MAFFGRLGSEEMKFQVRSRGGPKERRCSCRLRLTACCLLPAAVASVFSFCQVDVSVLRLETTSSSEPLAVRFTRGGKSSITPPGQTSGRRRQRSTAQPGSAQRCSASVADAPWCAAVCSQPWAVRAATTSQAGR